MEMNEFGGDFLSGDSMNWSSDKVVLRAVEEMDEEVEKMTQDIAEMNHGVDKAVEAEEIETKNESESVAEQDDDGGDSDFKPDEAEGSEDNDDDSFADSDDSLFGGGGGGGDVDAKNKGKKYRRRHYKANDESDSNTNNGEKIGFVVDKIQTKAMIESRIANEQVYMVYTPYETNNLFLLKIEPFKCAANPNKEILFPATQHDLNELLPANERYRSKDKDEWASYSVPLVAQLVESKDNKGLYSQKIIPITVESEKDIWNIELISKEEFRSYFHRIHLAKLKSINQLTFKTPDLPKLEMFENLLDAPKRRRYPQKGNEEASTSGSGRKRAVFFSRKNLEEEFNLIDMEIKNDEESFGSSFVFNNRNRKSAPRKKNTNNAENRGNRGRPRNNHKNLDADFHDDDIPIGMEVEINGPSPGSRKKKGRKVSL